MEVWLVTASLSKVVEKLKVKNPIQAPESWSTWSSDADALSLVAASVTSIGCLQPVIRDELPHGDLWGLGGARS